MNQALQGNLRGKMNPETLVIKYLNYFYQQIKLIGKIPL